MSLQSGTSGSLRKLGLELIGFIVGAIGTWLLGLLYGSLLSYETGSLAVPCLMVVMGGVAAATHWRQVCGSEAA